VLDRATSSISREIDTWNGVLDAELLDGRFEAQPLYLFVEPERLSQLGTIVGTPLEAAIARSLRWRDGARLFEGHYAAARAWEAAGKVGPPPFLSLLVTMTSAAAAMVRDQRYHAHNYRDRLATVLGVDGSRAEKLKRELPDTLPLWLAFNDWLEDWDGDLGLPTARVQGRLVYVGYPISQALVREQDRIAMRSVFERYGLAPGRRIGIAEMSEYIEDWIGRGQAPSGLTRLWQDETVHERIAQVACDELEHWIGISRSGTREKSPPPARLEWLAELALEPVPEIALYLVSRGDPDAIAGQWTLGARSDEAGRDAVASCSTALEMRQLPGLGAVSLEPWERIGATSLLAGVLELVRDDLPGVHLLRSPAPVLVLAYNDRDGRYYETSRAQLLERCLVLAHEQIASVVERHLATYARPGFTRLSADSTKGLPPGWVAFVDVALVQAADSGKHSKLAALCAAPGNLVSLSGGLRIGQGTWHEGRPPEVLAVLESDVRFALVLLDRRAQKSRTLGQFVGRSAVSLEGLEAGDYEAQIVRRKSDGTAVVVRRANFRLRSADNPRPAGVRRDWGLGLDLTNPLSVVSAFRRPGGVPPGWTRGVLIGNESWSAEVSGAPPPLPLPARRQQHEERSPRRRTRLDNTHFAQSCAVLGYHRWLCEPGQPDDNYKTLKWQECVQCHRFEWTRNRGVIRHKGAAAKRVAMLPPAQLPRYAKPRASEIEAQDLLLDALSYMGGGRAETLRALGAELNEDDLFPWRVARDLSALAHLDIELDRDTMRLASWQVTAPALAETTDGSWVLTGARSPRLVSVLRKRLAEAGLELARAAPDRGPSIYRVHATLDQLRRITLTDISTPLGSGISLASKFTERLLRSAPPLSSVLESLSTMQVGGPHAQRFDLSSARWVDADHDRPGAYRVENWGRTYGFTSLEDLALQQMRVTEANVAKHLAAREAGVSLLAYEKDRTALTTLLGAELPMLLERAAVACSGTLPRLRADLGQLEYPAVTPAIARALQLLLHG